MLGVSIVLFVVLLAVLFAVAAVTAGFGDLMQPVFQDARPVGMPETSVTPEDLDALRFNVVLRGYKMAEVDAVLRRLSRELAERDAVLAELRGEGTGRPLPPAPPPAPDESPTAVFPLVPDGYAEPEPAGPPVDDPDAYHVLERPSYDDSTQVFPVVQDQPTRPDSLD